MLTQIRSEFSRLPICFFFRDTMIIDLCELDLSDHCFASAVHGGTSWISDAVHDLASNLPLSFLLFLP